MIVIAKEINTTPPANYCMIGKQSTAEVYASENLAMMTEYGIGLFSCEKLFAHQSNIHPKHKLYCRKTAVWKQKHLKTSYKYALA